MPKPENIENHKYKKGQSGNPKGRPRKLPEIRQVIDEVLGEEKDGMTAAEAIFKKWRQMAMQGNIKAAELLLAYAYGRPVQRVEAQVELPDEININIIAGASPDAAKPVTREDDIIEPIPPPADA